MHVYFHIFSTKSRSSYCRKEHHLLIKLQSCFRMSKIFLIPTMILLSLIFPNVHCRYLVTTLKVVPRGTEGAVSVEGTLAGLLASILLASVACLLGEV